MTSAAPPPPRLVRGPRVRAGRGARTRVLRVVVLVVLGLVALAGWVPGGPSVPGPARPPPDTPLLAPGPVGRQGVSSPRAAGALSSGGGVGGVVRAAEPRAGPRWRWPTSPRPALARPFVPPTSTWGAGHRGLDLLATPGQQVHAVEAGVVTHAGVLAGRGTVTVTAPDGLRSTYEPVDAVVREGEHVRAGSLLGTLDPGPSHCAPRACLHLGAVRGRVYLDPWPLLAGARIRLLPLGPG